jgi:hypothetical protein
MLEEGVFASIRDLPLAADKQTRAQSMQGRMAMRRVRFPVFAPWWLEARKQLLQFPHAPHDDFVDALAWIGLGLDSMVGARPATEKPREYAPLTLGAIKDQAKRDRLARVSTGGW